MGIHELVSVNEVIDFAQRLVRVPSESGQEAEVANIIAEEMRKLGFDEVFVDPINNVIGKIKGDSSGPALLLSGHIDHAEAGAMNEPYSGKLIDGAQFGVNEQVVYGRGAVDMKGAIASMVYAAAAIKRSGIQLHGDVIVAGNSLEEVSAAEGTLYMLDIDGIKADMAVCGEATNLQIYLGHRGNAEVKVTVKGRMCHASNPQRGVNAVIKASEFIGFLMENYQLPKHEFLGDCTMTILDIRADTERKAPVVPDRCDVYVDRRILPGETKEDIIKEYNNMILRAKSVIKDFEADVQITKWGLPLFTSKEEVIVQKLLSARAKVIGEEGKLSAWIFGTDAAFIAERGIPTIGFGPGNEAFAHTPEDHVPVNHLKIATQVYTELILEICS